MNHKRNDYDGRNTQTYQKNFVLFNPFKHKYSLRLNIPRRPSGTDPLYGAGPDHCAEDGFNGRGADIGENFANLGFG